MKPRIAGLAYVLGLGLLSAPAGADRAAPNQITAKLLGGVGYGELSGIPRTQTELQLALGQTTRVGEFYVGIDGARGHTQYGLETTRLGAFMELGATFHLARVGLGARIAQLSIDRATRSATMASLGAGGYAFASVDAPWAGTPRPFLQLTGSAETYGIVAIGVAAGIGLRL